MELPDFNQDEGLLHLRREMGAKRLGHFVLFDGSKHLTGQERSLLENQGIKTSLEGIRILPDHTLAIKNGRVVVYFLNAELTRSQSLNQGQKKNHNRKEYVHVAACKVLQDNARETLVATTCQSSPFPMPDDSKRRSLSICPDCLSLLAYKGFSLTRNRRIRYSEQLIRRFQLADFFRVYTLYPVRIEGKL